MIDCASNAQLVGYSGSQGMIVGLPINGNRITIS